jgi:hypothetical protein
VIRCQQAKTHVEDFWHGLHGICIWMGASPIHTFGEYVTLAIYLELCFWIWDAGLWLMSHGQKCGSIAQVTYFLDRVIIGTLKLARNTKFM